MGVCRSFRTVLGGGDEIFIVLPNYLSSPVPTLIYFVLPTHLFYWVNLNRLGLQTAHPAPLQRFRIFPFLGRSRFSEVVGSNPASPSLDIPEWLFSLKRFQRDGRLAGFPKSNGIAIRG